ncbi:MAG: hypothetical protein SF028_04815 [Candidatus Sumerlaeia bacterium]|nr:hypothetical protein [Candidatus Sumerlaeia bacterium]
MAKKKPLSHDRTPGPDIAKWLRDRWDEAAEEIASGGEKVSFTPPATEPELHATDEGKTALDRIETNLDRQKVFLAGLRDARWMAIDAFHAEVAVLGSVLSRRFLVGRPNDWYIWDYTDASWTGFRCLVWGNLPAARHIALLVKRVGVDGSRIRQDDEFFNPVVRLFLALCDYQDGRDAEARARLELTGLAPFIELGATWSAPGGPAKALRAMLDLHKRAAASENHPQNYEYSCGIEEFHPVEVLAVLAVRRRLGLENPELSHPMLEGNPLFVLPDGPVEVPEDPLVRKLMDLVDYPACLEEERAVIETMPLSPLLDAPPPPEEEPLTDEELAKLFVGRKSQVERALEECAVEVRWMYDAGATAQDIFAALPEESCSFEVAEKGRLLKLSLFGRASEIESWTAKKPTIADKLPPMEVARRIGEALKPEYELRMLAATLDDSDILLVVKPAAFWERMAQLDAKKAAKVFSPLPIEQMEEPKKRTKKSGK